MKKLYIIIAMLLPTLLTAQEKTVQVPACRAGSAFTIRIPVRFHDSMTVQYAWYRNDTLIDDTHTLLLGEKTIAYTVPAGDAHGNAVYYFKYLLHDDCHEWTRSPRYKLNFQAVISCPALSGAGSISSIAAYSCNGVSGAGSISSITAN